MNNLQLTDGEMYELGDVVSPALRQLIESGDPENHEAKYGTATNLLAILRKVSEARWPGNPPDWMLEYESKVQALRALKSKSTSAAKAVEEFKLEESGLKSSFGFLVDREADTDGIRSFDLSGKTE